MEIFKKINLRFKVAVAWAMAVALLVFLCCNALFWVVKEKRGQDLARHSSMLANRIAAFPAVRSYLTEQSGAPTKDEVENLLNLLLAGDPFVDEITIIDQAGKVPFRISQSRTPEGANVSLPEREPMTPAAMHEILADGNSILIENTGDFLVRLVINPDSQWGYVKVHWKPEAFWKYYNLLKWSILCVTGAAFLLGLGMALLLLKRTYTREYYRLSKALNLLCGHDFCQRIDTQHYSPAMADIAVHVNRILQETEEEKKKNKILDDNLRQMERGCANYRKALNQKTVECEKMRQEMREGLIQLFDLLWCGVLIVDDEFGIHYINTQAERLLRFARYEESYLADDRLRTSLAPLVRFGELDRVDDLCVWPKPTFGQSVSCHVRAAKIPTAEGVPLYFVLLQEESGYPKPHNSDYYSKRLVFDILDSSGWIEESAPAGAMTSSRGDGALREWFQQCLDRLKTFHALEKGELGEAQPLRLASWMRAHFSGSRHFSRFLQIDDNPPELDIALQVPERVLAELLESLLIVLNRLIYPSGRYPGDSMALRASIDSRGKPVISISLPNVAKKQAARIHDLLNERIDLTGEFNTDSPLTLERLEIDICYSLFRCVKQLLRVQAECVYSENIQSAMVRLILEYHSSPSRKGKEASLADSEPGNPARLASKDMIQQYLTRE
ncbi:MAG: hypothetical protein ACE15F_13945 [bacterium]